MKIGKGVQAIPSLMKFGKGVQAILRFCLGNLMAVISVLLMERKYEMHHWDELSWHDIYIPSFMKIGTDVNGIFCLSSLKGCSADITDGGDL
jgi:hypothetical protein